MTATARGEWAVAAAAAAAVVVVVAAVAYSDLGPKESAVTHGHSLFRVTSSYQCKKTTTVSACQHLSKN